MLHLPLNLDVSKWMLIGPVSRHWIKINSWNGNLEEKNFWNKNDDSPLRLQCTQNA